MRKIYKHILIVIILFVSLSGYVYINSDIFNELNFNGNFEIANPSKIVTNENNDKYIIDNSKRRIVKLNNDNKVEIIINGGNSSNVSFFNATDLALDNNNCIYVLETVPNASYTFADSQRVLKYNSSGKFEKVLYTREYSSEDQLREGRIISLKFIGDKLYLVYRGDTNYIIATIEKETGEFKEVKVISYEKSLQNIIDFNFTEDLKNIVFVTKKGEIWLQAEDLTLIAFDLENSELFIPSKVKIDEQNDIYFLDIGSEQVRKYNIITKSFSTIIESNGQILRCFDVQNGFVSVIGDKSIITSILGEETIIMLNTLKIAITVLTKTIAFWLCLIFMAFLVVYFLRIIYIHFLGRNISTVFIQSVFIVLFIALTATIVINVMYNSFTTKYKEDISSQLKLIAYLSKDRIDINALERINKRSDYMNDDYKKVGSQIRQLFNENKEDWNNKFYGDVYKVKNNKVYSVMFYDDSAGAFFPYFDDFQSSYYYDAVESREIVSGTTKDVYGEWIYAVVPLINANGDVTAILEVGSDLYGFADHNRNLVKNIILEVITLLVILVIILIELTVYNSITDSRLSKSEGQVNRLLMIRPLAFILMFGYSMSMAFVPLLMGNLYRPILNIPESVVIGLPISFEMLFIAASSVIGGYLADKKGWRPVFILGAIIITLSSIFSAIAWEPISFIISRALCGLGYGFILTSSHLFTMTDKDENKQNQSLAYLSAGGYAGMSCGVAIGGMLAQRIGFSNVFYIIAIIVALAAVFSYKMMKNAKPENELVVDITIKNIIKFFRNLDILSFFICIYIPVSICSMFLVYFFPVFAENIGYTSADSSRIFMLYGICIIYIGPMLTKFVSKYLNSKISTIIYVILTLVGLAFFALKGTITSAIAAVIILGLAESFGIVVAINYFTNLRASKELGEGMSLGFYGLVENFGQMLGPVIIGSLVLFGYSTGIGILASSTAVLLLVFIVVSKKSIKKQYKATNDIKG